SQRGQGITQSHHYLWIVLPLATAAQLSQALPRMGLPVLYPFIQDEFGLSRAQVGLITSALSIGFAAVVLLAGWLTDNFGVRRIITISLLSLTALIFAFPLAYSFSVVLTLVVLIAITACPVMSATTTAIMDWFPNRIRSLAMSIKQTGVPIAGTLTAALLPALAIVIGWRMAAASTGLLIFGTAIGFILLYHNAPREIQTVRKFSLTPLKNILRKRNLVITIFWGAAFGGFQFITLSYFMLFLIEELEWSPIMAGGMLAIAQFSSIIARVLWGAISDFIFHGRRIVVLAITGFLTVLWMLGASLTGVGVPSTNVYLITIAIGISILSFHGVFVTLIGEQADAGQVGTTTGLAMVVYHVGMMVMPPLFGYLIDITSSYSLAWRATAAVALLSTLALLALGRESQRR
ncbi:MFS transporter, partial [Chloroflexota bacterium]